MNYGVILLILSLIFATIGKQTKLRNNFLIILSVFFLGFSYNMGGDWKVYKKFYENISESFYFEKGYIFINKIFYKLGIEYEIFQIIILIFCLSIVLKLLEKKSQNIYVAFVYIFINLLFPYSVEPILRQFIAVTIIIFSLKYIEEKKILKYLICVYIAILFHKSAIIAIFFYFINSLKFRYKKRVFLFLIIGYLLSLEIKNILEVILNNFSILKEYKSYLFNKKYNIVEKRSLLGNLYLIVTTISYLIIIFCSKLDRNKNIYFKLGIIGIIFNIFSNSFLILVRFNSYFIFPIAVAISSIDSLNINKKIKKIFLACLLIIQIFTTYYTKTNNKEIKEKYFYYHNYLIDKVLRSN